MKSMVFNKFYNIPSDWLVAVLSDKKMTSLEIFVNMDDKNGNILLIQVPADIAT